MEHSLFVIHNTQGPRGSTDETTLKSCCTSITEKLSLLPGENWLQWNETERPMPSILSLSAEVTDMVHLPPSHEEINSSVTSSYESSSLSTGIYSSNDEDYHRPRRTVPTERCYLCIDVDGAVATVKDMRDPLVPDAEKVPSHWTVHILNHSPIPSMNGTCALTRRRMRLLNHVDRIVFRHPETNANQMELEYRYSVKKGDEERMEAQKVAESFQEAMPESALRANEEQKTRAFREEAFTTQSPVWESASPPIHAAAERRHEESQDFASARHPQFNIQTHDDGMLSTLSSQQNTEEDLPSQEIAESSLQIPFGSSEPASASNGLLLTQPDRAPLDAAEDDDDDSTIDPRNTSADTRTSLPPSKLVINEITLPITRKETIDLPISQEQKSLAQGPHVFLPPELTTTPVRKIDAVAHMDTVSSSICSPDLLADSPLVPPIKNTLEDTLNINSTAQHGAAAMRDEPTVVEKVAEAIANPADTAVINLMEDPQYINAMSSASPSKTDVVANRENEQMCAVVAAALDHDVSNNPKISDQTVRSTRKRKIAAVSIGGTRGADIVLVSRKVLTMFITMQQDAESASSGSKQMRKTPRRLPTSSAQKPLAPIRILTTGFDFDNKQKKVCLRREFD
jgi:hypothetical protein